MDEHPLLNITAHLFEEGDAAGITRVIYQNYGTTYYKKLYYDTDAIKSANKDGAIISIVAKHEGEIVGHFAMIPSGVSNLAEIGAAVVDPTFKHTGIMNRMFDHLVTVAQQKGFDAIYGEGVMLHPYSQKANLHHGMNESALLLGEVPSFMEIEHLPKKSKRSGVLIAFLLFDKTPRSLFLPLRYQSIIEESYQQAGIDIQPACRPISTQEPPIHYRVNELLNTATLVINDLFTKEQLKALLETFFIRNCDMIYADINLHRIQSIDTVVEMLNQSSFFYSGIFFSFYANEDYLRLQRKNSPNIEEEQLVCYSSTSKKLLAFITQDAQSLGDTSTPSVTPNNV